MMSGVRPIYSLYLIILLLFASGCVPPSGSNVAIVSPGNGSIHSSPPQFDVSYTSDPTGTVILLNGAPVQQFFDFGETQGSLDGADVEAFLRQGDNTFQVNPPSGQRVTFIYDTKGPKVVIQQVSDSNPIEVNGRLEDPSGIQSLTVNGASAIVDANGNFSVSVTPAAIYSFHAIDNGNLESTTQYAAPGSTFDRFLTARVSQEALDFFTTEVGPILNDITLDPQVLNTFNRLINDALDEEFPFIGGLVGDLRITSMELGGPLDIGLDVKPNDNRGVIGFDADMRNISVALTALNLDVSVGVAWAAATGDAELYGNGGLLGIDLSNFNLSMANLNVRVGGFFGYLFNGIINLFANMMVPAFDDLISELISVIMNNIIDRLMEEIGNEFWVEINGARLGMMPYFESFSTDASTLHVVLGGGMTAETLNESVPPVLGSLYTSTPLPDAPDIGSHMFAAISSNLVNQAFTSAFQAGIHHLALYNQSEIHLGIDDRPDGNVGDERWLINPNQPAYFRVEDSGGDPTVFLVMDGLGVEIQRRNNSGWINQATVDLDFEARVTLGVNPDDTLRITFAGAPIITAHYVDIILLGEIDTDLVNLIINDFALPALMPELAETTHSIEIPSILGYTITVDDFQALGEGSGHLGAGLTLSKEEVLSGMSLSAPESTPITVNLNY